MDRDVTVVVPCLPARRDGLLQRALASVWSQQWPAECVIVEVDWQQAGAGPTRTRGLRKVETSWVAFLDDDDELLPHHLIRLLDVADRTGADIVVPWFKVVGGVDPFPGNRACGVPPPGGGMPSFPVTVIARTTVAREAVFPARDPELTRAGIGTMPEEYQFFTSLRDKGATFEMIPDETWLYHHHALNTSGLPR